MSAISSSPQFFGNSPEGSVRYGILPRDVQKIVFSYCTLWDLSKIALVCKGWNESIAEEWGLRERQATYTLLHWAHYVWTVNHVEATLRREEKYHTFVNLDGAKSLSPFFVIDVPKERKEIFQSIARFNTWEKTHKKILEVITVIDTFKVCITFEKELGKPNYTENPSLQEMREKVKIFPDWLENKKNEINNIKELVLSNLNLLSLPNCIFPFLHAVERLDVNENYLISIPESILHMEKLKKLFAHGNNLYALPENISKLTCLEQLTIYNNQPSLQCPALNENRVHIISKPPSPGVARDQISWEDIITTRKTPIPIRNSTLGIGNHSSYNISRKLQIFGIFLTIGMIIGMIIGVIIGVIIFKIKRRIFMKVLSKCMQMLGLSLR